MTVSELIERLSKIDGGAPVLVFDPNIGALAGLESVEVADPLGRRPRVVVS